MMPELDASVLAFNLPTSFWLGLGLWMVISALGWVVSRTFRFDIQSGLTRWIWLFLSAVLFVWLVEIPPLLRFLGGFIFFVFLVWALHTVPISLILGFYYRRKIRALKNSMVRIQGHGRIYSVGLLSVVVQKGDLTEQALSYTELLQKGLQISDHPPLSEWQITLPDAVGPETLQMYERRLRGMAWFAIHPAPSIWPQTNQPKTLIIRATLLRSQDYARVLQLFHRDLRALSKEPPLS
ncbi:MAG: hypothetical protein VXZ96_17005 [Myxococcota bacterium]|nr:hypothetical protein [Myxococcota bacterium]MEC8382033.1 hypothetical protein [Myxococcota bacterium]